MHLQEDIDLTHFVREANANQSRQKPSFAVIVKLPCLAVKYPSGSTYVRGLHLTQLSALLTRMDSCADSKSNSPRIAITIPLWPS
jgi:hypothetical protein